LLVPRRPLVLVSGLTLGDYLLWNWSLDRGHDVVALVSGLTLPPLALACLWLIVLNVARLVARSSRRPRVAAEGRLDSSERGEAALRADKPAASLGATDRRPDPVGGSPGPSSGKLAA
jgi:hypothetical protein